MFDMIADPFGLIGFILGVGFWVLLVFYLIKKYILNKNDSKVVSDSKGVEVSKSVSKPKKKLSKRDFIVPALIVLIVLAIVFFVFFYNPYKYSFVIDGVSYVSNDYTPTDFFKSLRNESVVFVSPIMKENAADPLVLNALNLWQIVLIGNGISAVQLIREVDERGVLLRCHTNDGNVFSNRIVEKSECLDSLKTSANFVISFERSNSARAFMSPGKLVVYSPMDSINAVNYSIMKQVFSNSEALVASVNEKIYGVNSP